MKPLKSQSEAEILSFCRQAEEEYGRLKAKGLKLDMSRGKPASIQVDLSNGIFDLPADGNFVMDGIDVRNYGGVDGLPSCKKLFAELLGVSPEEVFVGGNASLQLMYDTISKAYTHGLLHSEKPWSKLEKVKFLCPSPGYDRHFKVSQTFGMEMITIPMKEDGPDMDMVEAYITDPLVKGMWCVPKYSNPDGIVYSDEVVRRIARMKPAAPDFVLMWDNAYCVHEFEGEFVPFLDILTECRNAGNPDMPFEFASTSKITFPGAGISCFACSKANMAYMVKLISMQTISFDKVNQLRHVLFLKDRAHVLEYMKKHAAFLKPKFDVVLAYLDKEIAPLEIAQWHRPRGGYFISLNTMPGCAKRANQLAKEAGVVMTGAGATYPGGVDPMDSNLRIAPSYPPLEELKAAIEVFGASLKLATAEKLLRDREK
jgi:DNA-binding transcriptional MocR family regulator